MENKYNTFSVNVSYVQNVKIVCFSVFNELSEVHGSYVNFIMHNRL